MNQHTAFNTVANLVKDFKTNESKFLSPNYSEADVRKDFIDKFFDAMGWDVYHNEQKNPYEQEAKIERGITIGRQQKRADYAFYIKPNFRDVKFFVEAKKPSRNLSNADDYFQACRYGWNAGTQITFLTDFEELIVLDCRTKPDINNIINNKIRSYRYEDYLNEEKFAEIYWLISREAVADNSLEKFAESLPKPKGKAIAKGTHRAAYQSIDDAFLEELDEIRNSLAKAFKKANEHLGSDELTEMTQRTIDRLVFIRFLEDRQIEPEHYVSEFGKRKSAWTDFINASRGLDAKYNGIVFKKHAIDTEKSLAPDDKSFALICEELGHKNSPYNFDIIPIHILGSIYERFLGKVVIATDKRVRIEEKPEVRKAGGVYYTPQYIVNYIVDNTVGKLIEGKKPSEIAKMRFADISCGSGSFLITVFERVLEYHRKWYQENEEQAKKEGCILHEGKWILSIKQKQNILLNNIYGVDLDPQAIEVTQLSLYLKLLEDETTATANDMMVMFKEQILPSLNSNIVCGNSLIGTDILENDLFTNVETPRWGVSEIAGRRITDASPQTVDELKLKPMNFEDVFPHVFKKVSPSGVEGGFDAIVGNPPYVRQELFSDTKEYLQKKYKVYNSNSDLYTYFIEKGISNIKEQGLFSIIVANKWLRATYGEPLRKFLKEFQIKEIIDFGDLPVFKNISTYPCIIIVQKRVFTDSIKATIVESLDKIVLPTVVDEKAFFISHKQLENKGWALLNETHALLLHKISFNNLPLAKYVNEKIYYGIKTGLNDAFVIDEDVKNELIRVEPNCKQFIKSFLGGRDIKRYESPNANRFFIVIPKGWTNSNVLERDKQKWFQNNFPNLFNHLKAFETAAKKRTDQGDYWWELRACDYYEEFSKTKIMLPDISLRGNFIIDEKENYCVNTSYIIGSDDKYLLGILNSVLITFFYSKLSSTYRGGYLRFIYQYVEQIPIKTIDSNNKAEVQIKEQITLLVTQMLEAKKQLAKAKTEADKEYLEKKCSTIDRQIDQLVYELYGLTEEEIKIVEGN